MRQAVDEVIIALPVKSHYAAIERTIGICERVGVQVQYCLPADTTALRATDAPARTGRAAKWFLIMVPICSVTLAGRGNLFDGMDV